MIHHQRPPRLDAAPAIDATAPPQPIEIKSIETEFYHELGAAIAVDPESSDVQQGTVAQAYPEPFASPTLTYDTTDRVQTDLSPARRLAAPLFIASCAALVLLTHGAGAKRLLTMLPQAAIPKAITEEPQIFTGAWRQIQKHRAPVVEEVGRDDISPQAHADVRKALENGLVAAAIDEAPADERTPAEAVEPDPFFVPMALDIICSLPEITPAEVEAGTPSPQASIALTDLYPREPWSVISADAGPVGRARSAEVAVEAGINKAAYNPPKPSDVGMQPEVAIATPAPAPPPATRVRAAPQSSTKPAAPAEAAPSYDPFRGG